MAGRLGAAAMGAGSLGNMIFYPIVICGTGLLYGMDTLVSQAYGANDAREARRTLVDGLWISMAAAPVFMGIVAASIPFIRLAGANPHVNALFEPYLKALSWGILPLFLFTAMRRYLQSVNIVQPVMFAIVSANLINAAGNWALMYGHLGAPAMGLTGSAWSTSLSRVYMFLVLAYVAWRREHRDRIVLRLTGREFQRVPFWPHVARIWTLIKLGTPAAAQILFEGSVFGIITVLAARLDETSLAAHSVAVQVIATTFMVPLGISSAAAVRVGQAMGRRDPEGARVAGLAALVLSAAFMGSAAIAMTAAPRLITRLFIADAAVIGAGALLLRIAAVFELFDGLQVVATGALRGLGDTQSAMKAHFFGYWMVGLPMGYLLCFQAGWGVPGIWVGLTVALIIIGVLLVWVWRRRIGRLTSRLTS
jgi:MATE family multidrug resistance protein